MSPTIDIGITVCPGSVANWHLNYLNIELCRPEQKIEVTKGIEIAEIITILGD
jgi:hypothetical protein